MARELKIAKDAVTENEDGTMTVVIPDNAGMVTEDELRENYVLKTAHTKALEGVDTRISGAVDNARGTFRDEAIQDDEFLARAIKDRKEFFTLKFPKAGEGPTPEELFALWEPEHVTPLLDKITTLEGTQSGLQGNAVEGERSRALVATGVDPDHMQLMDDHLALRTQWSPEHGKVVVIDPTKTEDNVLTVLDGATLVPQSVEGYLTGLRKSGKYDHAFSASVRDGGDFDGGGGPPSSQSVQEQIVALESEGKFSEAGALKEQLVQAAKGSVPGAT